MTVSTIANMASSAIQRTLSTSNNKFTNSVKALIASGTSADSSRADTSSLTTAISLQTQVTGLRSASMNIAQASSMLGTADGGADQVGKILGKLKDLATRANDGTLSSSDRVQLNIEFQALKGEINRVASNTSFGGKSLLDGSVTVADLGLESGEGDTSTGLADLTESTLFGGESLNILTGDSAARAFEAISAAQDTVVAARADIGSFQDALEVGAATIESAIQNQEAARSELSDLDFLAASTQNAQSQVQSSASLSLLAQTNRLPANILQLLAE